jgi:hypothetical protein
MLIVPKNFGEQSVTIDIPRALDKLLQSQYTIHYTHNQQQR